MDRLVEASFVEISRLEWSSLLPGPENDAMGKCNDWVRPRTHTQQNYVNR
jgi:hypothetical protein